MRKKMPVPFLIAFLMASLFTNQQSALAGALTKADDIPAGIKLGLDVAQAIADQQNVQNGLAEFAKGQLDDWMWNSIGGYEKLWTGQLDDVDAISKQAKEKIKKSLEILQQIGDFATKVGEGKYDEALFISIDATVSYVDHPVVKIAWSACKLAYESHKLVQDTRAELEIETLYGMVNNDRRLMGTIEAGQDRPKLIPEDAETVDYFFNKYLMTNDDVRNLVRTYVRKVLGDEWPEQTWSQWLASWKEIGSGVDSARSAEIEALATEFRNKGRTWIMQLIKDLNKQVKVAWAQARVRQEMAEFKRFVERMTAFSGNLDELFKEFKQKKQLREELPKYKEFLTQSPQALGEAEKNLSDPQKLRFVKEAIDLWKRNLIRSYSAARLIGEEILSRSLQEQLKLWYKLEDDFEKKLSSQQNQTIETLSAMFIPSGRYPVISPYREGEQIIEVIICTLSDVNAYYKSNFAPLIQPFAGWKEKINNLKPKMISHLKGGDFESAYRLRAEWDAQKIMIDQYYNDLNQRLKTVIVERTREINSQLEQVRKTVPFNRAKYFELAREFWQLEGASEMANGAIKEMIWATDETFKAGSVALGEIYGAFDELRRIRQSQWGQILSLLAEMIKCLPIKMVTGKHPDSVYFDIKSYIDDPNECPRILEGFLDLRENIYIATGPVIGPDESIYSLSGRLTSLANSILGGVQRYDIVLSVCEKWFPIWTDAASKWSQFPKVSPQDLEQIEVLIRPVIGPWFQQKPVDVWKLKQELQLIEKTAKTVPGLISQIKKNMNTLVKTLDTDAANRLKDGEWLLERAKQVDAFFKEQIANKIFKIGPTDFEIALNIQPNNMAILDTPYRRYATERDLEDFARMLEAKWNTYPIIRFIKQYAPEQYQKMIRLARGEGIKRAPEENFIPIFSRDQAIYKSGLSQADRLLEKLHPQITDGEFNKIMDEISMLIPLTILRDDKHVAGWIIRDVIEGNIKGHPQYFQHPLGEQYVKLYDKFKKILDERTGYKMEERAKKEREQSEEWMRKAREEQKKQDEALRRMEEERLALLAKESQFIKDFYHKFKQAYESRNESQVVSFLGDQWEAGDGTTISDLRLNLSRSFKTFDEIRYNIQNLNFERKEDGVYRVRYDVTISSRIYRRNIKHEEKSSVIEEVMIEKSGRVKIFRTLSGRFWYTH